jgi:hypothetical protein
MQERSQPMIKTWFKEYEKIKDKAVVVYPYEWDCMSEKQRNKILSKKTVIMSGESGYACKYYESEGVFARLHLYMAGVYVCNYRYDPKSQKIGELIFPATLSKEKRKAAQMILAADRTPYKEALKFHSLMCFVTHYRNCIETADRKEKHISSSHKKRIQRSGGTTPLITTYRIDNRPIPAHPGAKRQYTKPTEQVSVRGFYRTTKTGKRVWVRPFTKYNGNSENHKTYKV